MLDVGLGGMSECLTLLLLSFLYKGIWLREPYICVCVHAYVRACVVQWTAVSVIMSYPDNVGRDSL
jgi:hypothetical protein